MTIKSNPSDSMAQCLKWLDDPMTPPPSIEAEELTRTFGRFVADDHLSFTVAAGETYGILGPNGAGKTTLIRMLTTLLPPTSGRARVQGHDVVTERAAVRAAIGTVSQAVTTDENLTVHENLSVQGKMYGMWGRSLSNRIERRLKEVGLWERRGQVARELSGGMRRRLEIARGVLHSPQVLFLDEPTAGLDPQSRRAIWRMLEEMTQTDAALSIVLTTHAMDEADHLCDRVAILDQGRILCEGAPETLKRGLATGERVEVRADREITARDREAILALGAVNWRSADPESAEFEARPGEGIGRRAAELLEARGYRVRHLTISPVTLEDVFFSYTGHALREA
jgi:ABC-2 type transport system ATP-binding protein